ncbi:MAG: hypothetical protein OXI50_08080 [Gammaproteobacteria bacterium]|nr:hypothetical protein [Gammaproteobacteria bacterium]
MDIDERRGVKIAIGLISASFAVVAFSSADVNLDYIAALKFGSPITLYGVTLLLYERWLWRPARRIGISQVPDFSGTWRGAGRSSHAATEFDAEIEIAQTWSKISIVGRFGRSESQSSGFAFIRSRGMEAVLIHTYLNRPMEAGEGLHIHEGTAELTLRKDGSMNGTYYTGRDRATHGTFTLTRVSNP